MNRITHECQQGTQAWLDLRAKHFTASEASAMMGESKYQTRSALLKAKATGISEEVDAGKQRLFDAGHAAEAAARPLIEEQLGTELYPVTMSVEIDGLPLLASLDGIDMLGDVIWECKLLNESLIQAIDQNRLDTHYTYQLEQQLLVSGAERACFTTSDGSEENTFSIWYRSNPELRAKLIAGWKQFAADLAEYQHVEAKPAIVADAIEDLPALSVQLVGQVTASNLDSFKTAVTARIQAINTALVTDADFANADKMVKFLDDGEKRLDLVKSQALAQTESIDLLFRTIDALKAEMRSKRLTLDKLVKAEKENRKGEIVIAASREFGAHCAALGGRVGIPVSVAVSFADAIKGLKSLDSMRDKVSVALANAKIEANAIADRIDANRKAMAGNEALFPDFTQVCTKAPDDFAALVALRVAQQKEADEKRLAAERERIRAEEQAKAQRESEHALAKQHAEFNARQGAAEAAAVREMLAQQVCIPAPVANVPVCNQSAIPMPTDSGQTIKLGEICTRLGFTVTADFLGTLGIHPVATEKNAKLYSESKFPTICRLISDHVMSQAFKKAA